MACDFPVVVTVRFRVLFVFLVMEVGSRRILHYNVTAHPICDWTLQQLLEAIPGGHGYQFLIHDRDSIFSSDLDEELKSSLGLRVLRTPARASKANANCDRLIGTVRRECLDFMIPLNEQHLRKILRFWVAHCNKGRPPRQLGPCGESVEGPHKQRHTVPLDCQLRAQSILYGLHHEYSWENCAARSRPRFLRSTTVKTEAMPDNATVVDRYCFEIRRSVLFLNSLTPIELALTHGAFVVESLEIDFRERPLSSS